MSEKMAEGVAAAIAAGARAERERLLPLILVLAGGWVGAIIFEVVR